MTLFPRPHILYLIALALALPTSGISLAVFYFLFKRPYDSRGVSAILAAAKASIERRRAGQVFRVNRGAIERVFGKFTDPAFSARYGGAPFIRWGVLRHPMLNGGAPFTLRVDRSTDGGGTYNVEASPGEAWWLLTDRVWLGRRGTAPGLPKSLNIKADASNSDRYCEDPDDMAMCMLIWELADRNEEVELPSLTYGRFGEFPERHKTGGEWFGQHRGMYFYVNINNQTFYVHVENLDPSKEDDGGVKVSASRVAANDPAPADDVPAAPAPADAATPAAAVWRYGGGRRS